MDPTVKTGYFVLRGPQWKNNSVQLNSSPERKGRPGNAWKKWRVCRSWEGHGSTPTPSHNTCDAVWTRGPMICNLIPSRLQWCNHQGCVEHVFPTFENLNDDPLDFCPPTPPPSGKVHLHLFGVPLFNHRIQPVLQSRKQSVTVAWWYRLPLETEQAESSIPGSVGYILPCSMSLRLLGSFRGSLGTYDLTQKLC